MEMTIYIPIRLPFRLPMLSLITLFTCIWLFSNNDSQFRQGNNSSKIKTFDLDFSLHLKESDAATGVSFIRFIC
jgi:hypothetical protein